MDAKTVEIHYSKHHQTYVDKLNMALEKHPDLFKLKVGELLKDLTKVPEEIRTAVKNNGGGHYNHCFFWDVITGDKNKHKFAGKIADEIKKEFGSFERFKEKFTEAALNRFGSGWAWLVLHNGKLEIYSTANQDCPISEGKTPLLTLDVWEHAYYLKYQNRRMDYVAAFWNIVDWFRVNEFYELALEKA